VAGRADAEGEAMSRSSPAAGGDTKGVSAVTLMSDFSAQGSRNQNDHHERA
jgi:hypothetical protein